ncbi:MAG TPA: hypothetical protein VEO54_03180 [Thermoanaerobaculia bacterium]|nr:hypothetical protein [Thermoanaerobaculia bacterium]
MKTRIWLLCVVLAAFAVPSFAQFSDRQILREVDENDGGGGWSGSSSYEQGQYMDNPCTAIQDWVWVNYSAYATAAQQAAGANDYLVDENTNVGGMYAASGSTQADVGYGGSFSIRSYHKVNTSDAFHVVTVVTVYPASKSSSVTVETACGNGMPDSRE